MRSASFSRCFAPIFLGALLGCAGNTTVPSGEADVPQFLPDGGIDFDTGTPPGTCPDGQTRCGDACFDLTSDRVHCGSCERACGDSESCTSAICRGACTGGQTDCGGACVDTTMDPSHCGACDTAC